MDINYEIVNNKVCKFEEIIKRNKRMLKNGTYNYTSWTIYVGVMNKSISGNWFKDNLDNFTSIDELIMFQCKQIDDDWFDNDPLPDDLVGFTIVKSNQVGSKEKVGSATIYKRGKNLNKSNRTNAFTQAISEANKKYIDRIDKDSDLIKPMLAKGDAILAENALDVITELTNQNKYNFSIQYKYDGVRCLVKVSKNKSVKYSRNLKKIILSDEIDQALKLFYNAAHKFAGDEFLIDGEIYHHDMKLSEINGYISRHATNEKRMLKYYIFDIVPINQDIDPDYESRIILRDSIFKFAMENLTGNDLKLISHYLINVENFDWTEPEMILMKYNAALQNGYEGLMMKLLNSPYLPDSRDAMFKLKHLFSEEFTITGFKDGVGKHKGLVIFICRATRETVIKAIEFLRRKNPTFDIDIDKAMLRKTFGVFSVAPNWSDEERKKMFVKFRKREDNGYTHFENNYQGKLFTVEFQDYSDKLVPIRPKGKAIQFDRNY